MLLNGAIGIAHNVIGHKIGQQLCLEQILIDQSIQFIVYAFVIANVIINSS